MKDKRVICTFSLVALLVFYVVCGGIYSSTQSNNSWATTLACLGFVAVLVALLLKAQWSAVFTAGGYLVGFIAAVIFQKDYVSPSGDTVNDLWAIWLWTYLGCILVGIIVELILLLRRKLIK